MTNRKQEQRVWVLLADRAVGALDRADAAELERLLEAHPELDAESMDLAAAALDLAMTSEIEPIPDRLKQNLLADATDFFGSGADSAAEPVEETAVITPIHRGTRFAAWGGWLAAAACLALAFLAPWRSGEDAPTLEERWRAMQTDTANLNLSFAATEDQAASGATGELAWDENGQTGLMRIRGLAVNDPTQQQYQLWIFDRERNEQYPVDGGVFDMASGQAEVLVPIDAKLPVAEPYLFAITVEKPGGVVVSSRERIVLVAQPAG